MYLIDGKKPTAQELINNNPRLLANLANSKINPTTETKINLESKIKGLDRSEKAFLASISIKLGFNKNPIMSFIDRCHRLLKNNPDMPLEEIVRRAEIGKKTGKKPNYER